MQNLTALKNQDPLGLAGVSQPWHSGAFGHLAGAGHGHAEGRQGVETGPSSAGWAGSAPGPEGLQGCVMLSPFLMF